MPTLVDQPFEDTFTFSRDRVADYHDAAGAVVQAARNTPRFDHTAGAAARGLLIEGLPDYLGAEADKLNVLGGWDDALVYATVLHEHETPEGEVRRRAWYVLGGGCRTVVDACLRTVGWQRVIACVPGYLRNRDGYVRWRNLHWDLGGAIAVDDTYVVGADTDVPLIEG